MTPRMLLKAQAQGHTSQCVLNQTSMKIDFRCSFLPAGFIGQLATSAESPILDMCPDGLSVCLKKKGDKERTLSLFPLNSLHKPFPGIATFPVCGGVA